jgi:hypothetical protein
VSDQLAELLERLQRLEDIETARGMNHAYAEALDDPVPATVAALFLPDGVLATPVGEFEGTEAIEGFFTKAFAADPSVKRHFITNTEVVEVAGRRVHLRSYFHYVGRGTRSVLGWGTYDDVVDVASGRPLLARKAIDMHFAGTLERGWAVKDEG